jgi:hypothetical protein
MRKDEDSMFQVNKYAGGLIVTVYRRHSKQVKKQISGIPNLRKAVNVASI